MKVVVGFTLDENQPSGGAKQLYRHVDILNAHGIDACIAHQTPGFRMDWFKNETKVVCAKDIELGPSDFLMFGEMVEVVPQISGAERCPKVIVVQNPYGMFSGFRKDLGVMRTMYGSAAAVLCQSDYTENNVRYFFPAANVMRFQYSFDRPPFSYNANKEKILAYMTRKSGMLSSAILTLIRLRRWPDGWVVAGIDGRDEANVSELFQRSAVFLSMSMNEGFGMPPAEAMSCGCAVVGFSGFAGDEYMNPDVCWQVRDYDILTAVQTLETVLTKDMSELVAVGKKASDFIRSKYSTEKEEEGIMAAWNKILTSRVEIRGGEEERVKKEVAAYVPVHNEGPYLENLLKWLVKRVGAVFVCESSKPWCSDGEPGGKSKEIVDKVLAEVPEAAGILRYALVGEGKETEPLKREAEQRNMMIPEIQKAGFKWVWMVEADEFYSDAEADRLWSWFFERAGEKTHVVRCPWHTYWRSLHWRIEPPELFKPNIIFRSDCTFENGRKMAEEDEANALEVPPSVCVVRHYSWSRTPSDTRRKLSAWGHAKQLRPRWFEDVFMAWTPGCNMTDFHPINAGDYKQVVRCQLPVPEALAGHPYNGLEIIGDGDRPRNRIKAVIMHHNNPENADRLYEALAPVFDDVAMFDNGSDPDKVPINVTRARPNVYWTGTWNEVLATCLDYDAVWVLGCDVTLLNKPEEYRRAIESSLPFGCWSPSIVGRAKPFMQAERFGGRAERVRNIEGIAMAVSKSFMAKVKRLPEGNVLGYGQDLWMCYEARRNGQQNTVDGRVRIGHPEGTGYNHEEAGRQMEETFTKLLGPAWRRSFEYSDFFEDNLIGEENRPEQKAEQRPEGRREMSKITVVTVDNGWGIPEFVQIVQKLENVRAIVMKKGVVGLTNIDGVETVPYEPSLDSLLKEADVALFPKVGEANREEYTRLLKAGVPVVVNAAFSQGLIEHEKNGFIYQDNMWAIHWVNFLRGKEESQKIRDFWATKKEPAAASVAEVRPVEVKPVEVAPSEPRKPVRVTVITPTFNRDPKIVKRCIDCMTLQTVADWEQLVCSNGTEESAVRDLVAAVGDSRVRYLHLGAEMPKGDFGNSARKAMLEKATGQYVMFCDDDNIILPHYMRVMADALDRSGMDFAVCRVMHFGPLNEAEAGKPPKVLTGEPVKLYHIDPLQVMVKKEVMLKVGWDTAVGYLSDGVTLEKLGKDYKHVTVGEVLGIHT